MAPGLYGADIEQLNSLSKQMGQAGSRLQNQELQVNGLISGIAWKGTDGERFRSEWNSTLRPMLHRASRSLDDASRMLRAQADEQQKASTQGGSSRGGSTGANGPQTPGGTVNGDTPTTGWEGLLSVTGSQGWWAGNALVTASGLATDSILAQMAKGGLVTELTRWPWLSAQYGQTAGAGYVKGTQLLNGSSMLGRLSGALGFVTGGIQVYQGIQTGHPGMAVDGGISAALAVGSFFPVVGPACAIAGIAWGGLGLLATNMGYDSASSMIADGAKNVWEGAQDVAGSVADGAKKVWGWLT
ncbi:WXG100 family type VII secretion target [Paenarthrobacter nitroguajacolicus]|uniref:WXG100 family type VII secretion target n=1 Tax=Paenarthrobacter nitroguajacolicus TaxID=211146 RepID=UPI004053D5AF